MQAWLMCVCALCGLGSRGSWWLDAGAAAPEEPRGHCSTSADGRRTWWARGCTEEERWLPAGILPPAPAPPAPPTRIPPASPPLQESVATGGWDSVSWSCGSVGALIEVELAELVRSNHLIDASIFAPRKSFIIVEHNNNIIICICNERTRLRSWLCLTIL